MSESFKRSLGVIFQTLQCQCRSKSIHTQSAAYTLHTRNTSTRARNTSLRAYKPPRELRYQTPKVGTFFQTKTHGLPFRLLLLSCLRKKISKKQIRTFLEDISTKISKPKTKAKAGHKAAAAPLSREKKTPGGDPCSEGTYFIRSIFAYPFFG